MKVLVLGDDTRSFLATVRSLGRRGMEVHAAPADFSAPALRSRYIKRLHEIPQWMDDGEDWLRAMRTLLARERFDVVIPCNETTLLPLCRHRAALSAFAVLAIPDDRAMEVLFDKHLTREFAHKLGIPVSLGRLPRATDTGASLLAELGTPVVVKPRRSYSLEQIYRRGKVRVVADVADLSRLLPKLDPAYDLFEQFIPGRGVGVSVLANQGRVLQAFEHHRVRETLGGSYYRVSAALTPDLLAATTAMVDKLAYTGLAMFEFRIRDDGKGWILLEVNARPWGSLPLPLACGVDFPGAWVSLLTSGVEEPPFSYKPGIYSRNLLPDTREVILEAARAVARPWRLPGFLASRAAECFRFLAGREHQDTLVRDDPRPAWQELLQLTRSLGRRLLRPMPGRGSVAHFMARQALRAAAMGEHRTITFVCDGNICRSPFAALALRRRLRGSSSSYRVNSAGMAPRQGRASPEFALRAAQDAGFDLSHHRSRYLTREMAESATVLIVFEEANRRAVLARYPDLETPILLLSDLDLQPEARMSIGDPVDSDLAGFTATYGRIDQALSGLPLWLKQPLAKVTHLPDRQGHSTR